MKNSQQAIGSDPCVLLAEAGMYRWGPTEDRRAEVPVDEHNHALAALRYLIATLDARTLVNRPKPPTPDPPDANRYRQQMFSEDPRIWHPIG